MANEGKAQKETIIASDDVKTALVLEGGGSKGAFEAGIIKYIHESNLKIDLVGGTSVGGLNAAYYAFGKVPELLDLWSTINNATVYEPHDFSALLNLPQEIRDKMMHRLGSVVGIKGGIFRRLCGLMGCYFYLKSLKKRFDVDYFGILSNAVNNIMQKNAILD